MDAIKSYLENMFLHLPKTAEVLRAKEELAQMMEDKYTQLRSEGRTDNEAVGQVISEFGNLEELAETLGIPQEVKDLDSETKLITMTDSEVERYLQVSKDTGKQIALGVAIILLGVANLIFVNAIADRGFLAEKVGQAIGVGGLLLLIALAVYIFIMAGMKSEKYEKLETTTVKIDPYLHDRIAQMKEDYRPAFARRIAGGVALILLGVVGLVTVAILDIGGDFGVMLTVVGLLLAIGLAVGLFISAGTRMEAYDKLLNEGDYTRQHKAGNTLAEKISGPYWMLVVTIYLTWSFIRAAWGISWIVFPIAGVLFGLISVVSASFSKQ
ncbi:MAG TPA: permease prefix domain 1-containing protein [Anaerolineaceae bacterium]|nr:permease prefix domain 1-containing protein [Anaerolineaceae bacterium]